MGPGALTIGVKPNPPGVAWELGLRGLVGVATGCNYEGEVGHATPFSIPGRGGVTAVCPVAQDVNEPGHIFSLSSNQASNVSLGVNLTFR